MRDAEINDNPTGSYSTGVETRLLNNFVDGAVDYKGRPVLRSKSGVEVAERFAYYGVSSNLIDRILRTIDGIGGRELIFASLLYILALESLALSTLLPSSQLQVILFFISLNSIAFTQGGHKPRVQAFGGDQFDANDPDECRAKSSFFNW
ncbi:hypothetical protein LXL04_031832 [Taraxacum kok-saghyz]